MFSRVHPRTRRCLQADVCQTLGSVDLVSCHRRYHHHHHRYCFGYRHRVSQLLPTRPCFVSCLPRLLNTTTGIVPVRTGWITIPFYAGRHVRFNMVFSNEFSPAYRTWEDVLRCRLPVTLAWWLISLKLRFNYSAVDRGEAASLILNSLVSLLPGSSPNNGCTTIAMVHQI